jgi:hypothetical protein
MPEVLARLDTTDLLAIALGAALLVFGRRLYWLALGGAGFFAGLWIAGRIFERSSSWVELGLGFLLGVAGAALAVFVQKLAIGIAGFVLGGASALWIASRIDPAVLEQPSAWLLVAGIVGAVVGIGLASTLFEASLIAFSSLAGALLIASRSHLGSPRETWLFLALLAVGVLAQSRRRRRRPLPASRNNASA